MFTFILYLSLILNLFIITAADTPRLYNPTDHILLSMRVKGSLSYMDPEYYMRQQLTYISDVYSFGVVLLEVLCGRPAIFQNVAKEQHMNLAEWAKRCYCKAAIDRIIDTNLKGEIAQECLRSFIETAMNCVKDQGIDRPAMNDVVRRLEFALQLQEAAGNGMLMHGGSVGGGGGETIGSSTEDDDTQDLSDQDDSAPRSMSMSMRISSGAPF